MASPVRHTWWTAHWMARIPGRQHASVLQFKRLIFPTPVSTKTQLSELAVEGLSQLSEELDEESGFFLAAPFGAALSSFSPASFAVFLCPSSLAQAPLLSGRPKRLFVLLATRRLSELPWLPPRRHPHAWPSPKKSFLGRD